MKRISCALVPILLGSLVSVAAYSSADADQASLDALREHCAARLNIGPEGCSCIADTAGKDLNDTQQSLLVAMLSDDQAAAGQLRNSMPVADVTQAAMFMVNAPAACAKQ